MTDEVTETKKERYNILLRCIEDGTQIFKVYKRYGLNIEDVKKEFLLFQEKFEPNSSIESIEKDKTKTIV